MTEWHRFSVKFGYVDYAVDTKGRCILWRIIYLDSDGLWQEIDYG